MRTSIVAVTAGCLRVGWRRLRALLAFAVAFAISAPLANAAQISAPFKVKVSVGGELTGGICSRHTDPSTFGAIVNIVCATGAFVGLEAPKNAVAWTPVHGGAYRFTRVNPDEIRAVSYVQSTGSYTGVGTVTSWRMVSLADREYLEMLIDW